MPHLDLVCLLVVVVEDDAATFVQLYRLDVDRREHVLQHRHEQLQLPLLRVKVVHHDERRKAKFRSWCDLVSGDDLLHFCGVAVSQHAEGQRGPARHTRDAHLCVAERARAERHKVGHFQRRGDLEEVLDGIRVRLLCKAGRPLLTRERRNTKKEKRK